VVPPDGIPDPERTRLLKVLHTEWSLGWGGQEIRIVAEMKAFRDRGVAMALAARRESRIAAEAAAAGFAVHHVPFSGRLHVASIRRLSALLRRDAYSLIHTHSSVDSWCGGLAGKLAGVGVVRSRHLSAGIPPGLNARIVYRWLADAVIASGELIRGDVIATSGCSPERVASVPAGADHRRFHPEVDASKLRAEFGLRDAGPVVGIVGVLRSWKGHRVLFDACARIKERFPGLRVFVVGDGPMRDQIPLWAAELGISERVILAGHRDDVPECMKAMDVCVLPSLKNEATSQVMPQAMLVGTPVIASSAGGLTEVVQEGVTGRVVPPGDAAALASALASCLGGRAEAIAIARRAREIALERFTFDMQIERTLAVYRRLAGG
jgi:glycosyltransferase involved in cell wall biosynthesis